MKERGELLGGKKGQVTIFIIIAIVIIVAGVLIYFFYPEVETTYTGLEENPKAYIQNCVEDVLEENVETLSRQGGSMFPRASLSYLGDRMRYLCYTSEYCVSCVNQQPLLKEHVEEELNLSISSKMQECFDSLRQDYESNGYEVTMGGSEKFDTKLLPNQIITAVNRTLTLKKGDSVREYDSFNIILDNNLYELVYLVRDIIEWEVYFGQAVIDSFKIYYPEFKFEMNKIEDGVIVYIITEKESGNKFQFASRSIAEAVGFPCPPRIPEEIIIS